MMYGIFRRVLALSGNFHRWYPPHSVHGLILSKIELLTTLTTPSGDSTANEEERKEMSEKKLERCPICRKTKRVAAKCLTCSFVAVAIIDPHAHDHRDKYEIDTTRLSVALTTSSANTALDGSGIVFKVANWPPKPS